MLKEIDYAVSGDEEYRKARAEMLGEANMLEAEMRKLDEQRDAIVDRIHEADMKQFGNVMKQFGKDLEGKVLCTGSAFCFNVVLWPTGRGVSDVYVVSGDMVVLGELKAFHTGRFGTIKLGDVSRWTGNVKDPSYAVRRIMDEATKKRRRGKMNDQEFNTFLLRFGGFDPDLLRPMVKDYLENKSADRFVREAIGSIEAVK